MLLPKPSSHFPPFGALLAEGVHLGLSTAPLLTPSMKTLKKQWLEVLSISQYVLCFVFLAVLNCLLYVPSHREYFLSCGEFELSDGG